MEKIGTKKALVCGAGGFIGSHLVRRLKRDGYWVRGVDQKHPEFSPTAADDFQILDLREAQNCVAAVKTPDGAAFDEVYQLAADMGGMGFIHSAECEIMHNSCLINVHMTRGAALAGVKRYLFSSSACVYRDMEKDEANEVRELLGFEENTAGALWSAPVTCWSPSPARTCTVSGTSGGIISMNSLVTSPSVTHSFPPDWK